MPLDRSIPAFYCCYLLRSTVSRSAVYIGSTPNPVRRLRQHNGLAKGGAARTSRESLRPWEMTCIVTGFPSHIAALQFEWAWHNPHVTLHIPSESRLQHATQKKRSGQPKRPRHTIVSVLSNLHVLLGVPSFSRWPLEVRFFSDDAHKAWLRASKQAAKALPDSLRIIQDFQPLESTASEGEGSPSRKKRKASHGINALRIDHENRKQYLEKAKGVIDFEREGACAVCHEELEHDAGIYVICPSSGCEAVSHLTCLSKHFLKNEDDVVVPIKGSCPSCKAELKWIDVVQELSLRMRGQKEVEKLLKRKRAKKGEVDTTSQAELESDTEDNLDEEMERDIEEEVKRLQKRDSEGSGRAFEDSWYAIDDSDDSDTGSILNNAPPKKLSCQGSKSTLLGTVVEDSDWDEAEELD